MVAPGRAGEPLRVAGEAHGIAVDLLAVVAQAPRRRVGVAADPADPVTGHAVGLAPLVVAAGARGDVRARRRTVEGRRAGGVEPGRVGVPRARARWREVLGGVAADAE